jgi:Response regulators consisting of a CheY-like receiver domain and a winged-helix DNA-binding domain
MNDVSGRTDSILVVDDESEIVTLVAFQLENAGYVVHGAYSGREAIDISLREPVSLVILDLMLPDISGLDVLATLRSRPETENVAVLLLTALREDSDRVRGLAMGADDYLTKPFNPEELVLRVGAILRRGRSGRTPPTLQTIGDITIDHREHDVSIGDDLIDLTQTEYRLLSLFADNMGMTIDRQHLLQTIWGADPDMHTRTVDVHVQRLRAKLGPAGAMIKTVRGSGYQMNLETGDPQ